MISLLSCAGNSTVTQNQVSPIVPDLTGAVAEPSESAGHVLWAYYNVFVDPQKMEIELIPLRQVADHWNVLRWLEQGPCTNCVKVPNIEPSGNGTLLVDVEITHPYPIANFTGFDVRGIAIFDGSHSFPVEGLTTPDRSAGDGELVNADGYTTLYNGLTAGSGPNGMQGYMKGKFASVAVPDAELNGFIRYFSDDPDNTRNAFYAGDSLTRTFEIDMPDGPFVFGYAIDANWAPPTNKPVTNPMVDFPSEANCPEPWRIDVVVIPYFIGLNTQGGSDELEIRIYDWQGKDSYSNPVIECPELFLGQKTAAFVSTISGYDRWTVHLANEFLAPAGFYECMVKAVDDENAGSPDWLNLTAYQVVTAEVIEWYDMPPSANGHADPLAVNINQPVNFDDFNSYDPDGGSIVLWEWDYENDGVYDEEGQNVIHSYSTGGEYAVQMRVTDDEGSTDTMYAPLYITVNFPPEAVAIPTDVTTPMDVPVLFSGSDSTDSDGTIVEYEWDWDNDSVFDETGMEAEHSWDTEGEYQVNLRVTDDFGATDTLDVPIDVHVEDSGWAKTWGGSGGQDRALSVDFDTEGNVYTCGFFKGTVDFDPGPGVSEGTAYGNDDIFLSRLDPNGNYQWVITIGSTSNDHAQDVVFDESNGSVYLSGYYMGTVDFDPGPGVADASSDGGSPDAFVAKYLSDGSFDWVRTWGGAGADMGMSLDVDIDNEITVVGMLQDSVDIDPNVAEDFYDSEGESDISMTRLSSQGDTVWVQAFGGTGNDGATAVACDGTYVHMTGFFSDTVDFDPGFGVNFETSNGDIDAFYALFDVGGGFTLGAVSWGGTQGDAGYGVAVDSGNIYVTGGFRDTVDFDPDLGTDWHDTNGETDAFFVRYDIITGVMVQAITWGGPHYDMGQGICTMEDLVGGGFKSYVTGMFTDTVDFNPEGAAFNLTSNGLQDIFVARFDGSSFETAVGLGGIQNDSGLGISGYVPTGMVGIVGAYQDTVDFDPGAGVETHTSYGSYDAFCMKLTQDLEW